jgi:hypothetical protein
MTSAELSADYEAFQWVPPGPILSNPPRINRPGIAEIKPHTRSGIAAGVRQLRGRTDVPTHYDRWLVTYRLVAPPSKSGPGRAQVLTPRKERSRRHTGKKGRPMGSRRGTHPGDDPLPPSQ